MEKVPYKNPKRKIKPHLHIQEIMYARLPKKNVLQSRQHLKTTKTIENMLSATPKTK
jgi:hypothetical protein